MTNHTGSVTAPAPAACSCSIWNSRPRPHLQVVYRGDDLALSAADVPPRVARCIDIRLDLLAVTRTAAWHTTREAPITARGPAVRRGGRVDAALGACRAGLRVMWRPLLVTRVSQLVSRAADH